MADPYLIEGPALISFSGGRTSAYMLYHILQAHGGTLPDDVVVAFANTGKEREETLRFVHECGSRWNVPIRWVEWRPNAKQAERAMARARPEVAAWIAENATEDGYAEVGLNSANRAGTPFEGLIALRGRLPNPLQRFCSRELKVEPIKAICRALGWDRWKNVIGLRHDEGHRVLKKYAENDTGGHRWTSVMPLDKARVTKRDVMAFWNAQPFDLQLRPHEGNCDLCFLKSESKLRAIIRDNPGVEDWWIAQEAGGKRFERSRSFAEIARATHAQPLLPLGDDEHDAECGLWCGPDEEAA